MIVSDEQQRDSVMRACYVPSVVSDFYNPMDCSPPGSSVHGILQSRTLQWAASSSSRGTPYPGMEPASHVSPELQADSLLLSYFKLNTVYVPP